ncbi:MAG: hypothetical protein KBG73_00455 [Candidatus Promineofilum sp.]|jgi:hypothetical protein|nr:hypothetical protein [Promineifilum sp.]
MTDDIDRVALHEAGHAVVALLLLGDAAAVGMVRATTVGETVGEVYVAWPPTAADLRLAILALAGPEASRLAGDPAPYSWGAYDVGQALAAVLLATGIGESADLRGVLADAVDAVDTARRMALGLVETHWEEITRGARALADAPGRVMTGPEFARAAGGSVACYAETEKQPAAVAVPGYIEIARCPVCGVAAVMPHVVAGWLNPSTTAAWAAVQLRAAGCTHSGDDGAAVDLPGDVDDGALGVSPGMVPNGTK